MSVRGLGFKKGGCGGVWVLGVVLEGDRTFCRKGDRTFCRNGDHTSLKPRRSHFLGKDRPLDLA
ncbi:hypothetical protein [Microcoleus sp. OTE_8_concoct_300]|uniref:hypothetical protein n=1 Tax=Microcoleus sp. OTE_8_concoct_300 TaxID=2964710 RepID=UPI00403F2437